MPAPFDNIVQHLFHQPSLHSVTVDELEMMATEYPYFAAAHFLLLKKMQDTSHPAFGDQLHKTTLYFNNPLWLQYLLQPGSVDGFKVLDEHPFIANGNSEEAAPQLIEVAETPEIDHVHVQNDEPVETEESLPAVEIIEKMEELAVDPAGFATTGDLLPQEQEIEASVEAAALHEGRSHVQANEIDGGTGEGQVFQDAPIQVQAHADEIPVELQEMNSPAAEADDVPDQEHTAEEALTTPQSVQTSLAAASLTIIETSGAKDDLLFEPYHTVDYFASQGISLSAENESKDKLGKQLRSFTDWLKTMKKLPQVSIEQLMTAKDESRVLEDAAHSIENKEVVTETMAEVFEKQGLHEEAAEIYRKLSLLNPSKSTYFAAKLEALKN